MTRAVDTRVDDTRVNGARHDRSRPQRERLSEAQCQALIAAWERIVGGKKT